MEYPKDPSLHHSSSIFTSMKFYDQFRKSIYLTMPTIQPQVIYVRHAYRKNISNLENDSNHNFNTTLWIAVNFSSDSQDLLETCTDDLGESEDPGRWDRAGLSWRS